MKMKYRVLFFIVSIMFQVVELMAAPGGKIVRDIFDNPIGRIISVLLVILFFPWLMRSWYKRKKAVSRAKEKLNTLSEISHEYFDEVNLKNRVSDIFSRVHKAWSEVNVENLDEYITHWYRQNQQNVFLDEWKRKGMLNVCTIKKVNSIEPIHIRLSNKDSFEGTRIMYAIAANMEDYLVKIDDSSVVEGKRGFNDVEFVWTVQLVEGKWKLDNIEQQGMVSEYLKMSSALTDKKIDILVQKHLGG